MYKAGKDTYCRLSMYENIPRQGSRVGLEVGNAANVSKGSDLVSLCAALWGPMLRVGEAKHPIMRWNGC